MDRKNCNLVSSCTHSAYYLSKQTGLINVPREDRQLCLLGFLVAVFNGFIPVYYCCLNKHLSIYLSSLCVLLKGKDEFITNNSCFQTSEKKSSKSNDIDMYTDMSRKPVFLHAEI